MSSDKIVRLQYKAVRHCIGAMESIPCLPVLAESLDLPLYIRREFLARKYIVKAKNLNLKQILTPTYNNAIGDLTNRFWKIKDSPPLVSAFRDISHLECLGKNQSSGLYWCANLPYDYYETYNFVSQSQ
ncbi:hypothetical protein Trydic_g7483 [Trypoxylus dichotomus]